jgi:ankyrin repeat protein
METLELLLRHTRIILDLISGRGTRSNSRRLASHQGDIIMLLIAQGVEITAKDFRGNSALHLASKHPANESVIESLLSHGPDLNPINRNHQTPLHTRTMQGNWVRMLLCKGAEPNLQDVKGRTPLHYCASSFDGSFEGFELLLEHGVKVNITDNKRRTPLHLLLGRDCYEEKVELLVKFGVDIDATDYEGRTALHYLFTHQCHRKHISYPNHKMDLDLSTSDFFLSFLSYGPSLNFQDDMGRTALDCALASGTTSPIDDLKSMGALAADIDSYCDSEISWVSVNDSERDDFESTEEDEMAWTQDVLTSRGAIDAQVSSSLIVSM